MHGFTPTDVVLLFSREGSAFDLGVEVGNPELYCQTVVNFVIEAIAVAARSAQQFIGYEAGLPNYSWTGVPPRRSDILDDYNSMVARFAFVVGHRLDMERISGDIAIAYEAIEQVIATHYPNWPVVTPHSCRVAVSPAWICVTMR